MNTEVIKAMNRKPKNNKFSKWWSANGYKVLRVILFPLWLIVIVSNKIQRWTNNKNR